MFLSTVRRLAIVVALYLPLVLQVQLIQAESSTPCVLEMPVYDPFGNRLPAKVVGVALRNGMQRTEILGKSVDGIRVNSDGDRVLFSSIRIIGKRAIEVTLEGSESRRVTSQVFVTSCRQRRSVFWGQSETGLDVSFVPVIGRLSGCTLRGDWWVRAIPMVGGHDGTTAEDGYIEPDGSFSIQVAPAGVRRIVVIGKGRLPIKSIGVDVTVGRSVDIGVVNLAGVCP